MKVTKVVDGKRVLCESSFEEWFKKEKPDFGVALEKVNGEFDFKHKPLSTKGAHMKFDMFGVRIKMNLIKPTKTEMLDGEVFASSIIVMTTMKKEGSDFYIGWTSDEPYDSIFFVQYFKTYLKIYHKVLDKDWDF